jgi:prepilin-type N-terminal cleavage/methylation domain-containing protein
MSRYSHQRASCISVNSSAGFTLLELIVCLFVIGLLVALLIPAVQQVREAARATECRSKLHQISLAIQNYLDLHQCFPSTVVGNDYSYFAKILPQLEQASLFAEIQASDQTAFYSYNSRPLPMLMCPSDARNAGMPFLSYYLNHGNQLPETGASFNGFTADRPLKTRDVPDGLSQTAVLSETMLGHPTDPRSKYWKLTSRTYARGEEEIFADDCQAMPQTPGDPFDWLDGGWIDPSSTDYVHFLPPNHRSCQTGLTGAQYSGWTFSARNAGSWHVGMAHTSYADGSVRVTSDSIDRSVWRALGSRNGGEVIP